MSKVDDTELFLELLERNPDMLERVYNFTNELDDVQEKNPLAL